MTNTAETMKEQTLKQSPKTAMMKAAKVEPTKAVKEKEAKPAQAAKDGAKGESSDRLPATIDELKASKAGFACYPFLSGRDKPEITQEFRTEWPWRPALADFTQALRM